MDGSLETASIIIQAALTGHLVLSTLHTNDAVSGVIRLLDMGIEPFLVAGAVHGIFAQRLVRTICPHCKMPVDIPDATLINVRELSAQGGYLLPKKVQFYRGAGCEQCFRRGYKGRTGLFNLLEMTPPLREAIMRRASPAELTANGIADGMRSFFADGIRKALDGITTVEEVFRLAGS